MFNILPNVNTVCDIDNTICLLSEKCTFVLRHFAKVFVNIVSTDQSQKREDIIQLTYQDKI